MEMRNDMDDRKITFRVLSRFGMFHTKSIGHMAKRQMRERKKIMIIQLILTGHGFFGGPSV
jgi:hypothetical protein